MKSSPRVLIAILLLCAGAATYYWLGQRQHTAQPVLAPKPEPSTVHAIASPPVRFPVPIDSTEAPSVSASTSETPTLPRTVEASDTDITDALIRLFGKQLFDDLFIPKDIIRRIVVTIDNATRERQPSQDMWPLKPPSSAFLVSGQGSALEISPKNFARYQPYIELVRAVSVQKLAAVYVHFYPLFQSAYRDLGTQGYFNDRLVDVIDNLLNTPDLVGSVQVVAGVHGSYQFASSYLQSLSSGQKIIVRMGYENAQVIKSKLRQLRARLVRFKK